MRKMLLPVLIFLLAALRSAAQAPGYAARLDSLFTLLDKHNKFMGGIALRRAGKPLYARNTGYVKLPGAGEGSPGVRGVDTTAYHIGSESKVFTAVMILQLIDEQKLQRETRLSALLPGLPGDTAVTVDELLRHRSGLHSFTDDPGYDSWMGKAQSRESMLARIAAYPHDFRPGGKYEYSNTNYLLLGYIVEQLDGTDYATALARRITGPLRLRHTGVYRARNDRPGYVRANSYEREEGQWWTYVKQTDPSVTLGAGSVEASPSDMCVFVEALLTGRLTSDSLLRYMRDLGPDNYGAGLFSLPYGSRRALGHNGRVDGFHSIAFFFPDDSLSIAITGNGVSYPMQDLALSALNIYYGVKTFRLPSFDGLKLPAAVLEAYAGRYHSEKMGLSVTLRREGDQLLAQPDGQSEFALQAESAKRFAYGPAGITIDFEPGADGGVKSFLFQQRSNTAVFTKE